MQHGLSAIAINESLQVAGFDDIRISVLPLIRSVPEMASFAAGMLFGSPALAEIVRRPGINPSHVHEALTLAFGGSLVILMRWRRCRQSCSARRGP